jgi:hypothetical protein
MTRTDAFAEDWSGENGDDDRRDENSAIASARGRAGKAM